MFETQFTFHHIAVLLAHCFKFQPSLELSYPYPTTQAAKDGE
jgi:hypothetical protein